MHHKCIFLISSDNYFCQKNPWTIISKFQTPILNVWIFWYSFAEKKRDQIIKIKFLYLQVSIKFKTKAVKWEGEKKTWWAVNQFLCMWPHSLLRKQYSDLPAVKFLVHLYHGAHCIFFPLLDRAVNRWWMNCRLIVLEIPISF